MHPKGQMFKYFRVLLLGSALASAACAAHPWFRGPGVLRPGPWPGPVLVPVLPRSRVPVFFEGEAWYFSGGAWYRPLGHRFALVTPPVGIVVPVLPPYVHSFWNDGIEYFVCQDIYYIRAPRGRGFMVTDPPQRESSPSAAVDPDPPIVLPTAGQDEATARADVREAKRYAAEKSGYDPARSDPRDPGTGRARAAYLKAFKAYLAERGYSVK
jgi:hypothetical protein